MGLISADNLSYLRKCWNIRCLIVIVEHILATQRVAAYDYAPSCLTMESTHSTVLHHLVIYKVCVSFRISEFGLCSASPAHALKNFPQTK